MKQTFILFFAIVMTVYFSSCGLFGEKSDNKPTTKNQVTETDIAPEKNESAGDKVDPNNPEYYPGGPQPTGVYSNGQSGFNFNFSKYDLLDEVKGDYGITKSGTYFCKKKMVDDGNFKKNPRSIKIAGYFSKDSQERWRWKDVAVKKFNDVEYYIYENAAGPVFDINDNGLFCFWYYGSTLFYPHEGVKAKVLAIASDYAL